MKNSGKDSVKYNKGVIEKPQSLCWDMEVPFTPHIQVHKLYIAPDNISESVKTQDWFKA